MKVDIAFTQILNNYVYYYLLIQNSYKKRKHCKNWRKTVRILSKEEKTTKIAQQHTARAREPAN